MKNQTKLAFSIIVFLVAIIGIIIYKNSSSENGSMLSEQQAGEIAIKAVINDGRQKWLKYECASAFILERGSTIIKFDVNEVHNESCGGDPNTSPRITSVVVDLKTGVVIKKN